MTIQCNANATGRIASEWGMESVPCNVERGLRSMIDSRGIVRQFCGSPGHRENVERRFGRLSEATRVALAIERISADFDEELDEDEPFAHEGWPELNGSFR